MCPLTLSFDRSRAFSDSGGRKVVYSAKAVSKERRKKRYEHLERFSVAAVHQAVRASRQLDQISAMVRVIARDEGLCKERKALLEGLEALAQSYASEARMDMEHMSIAQLKHTPRWKQFKRQME
jgi:hypothetical protein